MSPPAADLAGVGRAAVKLSTREHEVLSLLVAGKPDREIAETLFLSVRTVRPVADGGRQRRNGRRARRAPPAPVDLTKRRLDP
jgi:FixJ family two-component response regulator